MESSQLPWVGPIIQLATAGGFGALVWYLVVKHIPTIEDRHKDERIEWHAAQDKRDAEYLGAIREVGQHLNTLSTEIRQRGRTDA